MKNSPLGLTWALAPVGIRVTLINMHGSADAFSTGSALFEFSEDGLREAQAFIEVLEHLPDAVCRDIEGSLEDVCARLAKKLGREAESLAKQLDGTFVHCSAKHDSVLVVPVAYLVELQDEAGPLQRALFGGVRYKSLHSIDPVHLRQWA